MSKTDLAKLNLVKDPWKYHYITRVSPYSNIVQPVTYYNHRVKQLMKGALSLKIIASLPKLKVP